ncbi:MAG: ATP-binding protein [Syntrophomonadaceae bacterium]
MDYFKDIIGQDKAISNLLQYIKTAHLSHAYAFLGPAGVGKMLAARAFAYSVIYSSDPDGVRAFSEDYPDILIINKPENKTVIGKEQITRVLEPWLSLRPYRAEYRIVIVRDAHLMSKEAANALLKTLEEPPHFALIILVCDEDNLPETIFSRCQVVRFSLIPSDDIKRFLAEKGFKPQQCSHIAMISHGSLGLALQFAQEEELDTIWEDTVKNMRKLLEGEVVHVFEVAEGMNTSPVLKASMMETILRDLYIFQETGKTEYLAVPQIISQLKVRQPINPDKIRNAINKLIFLRQYYRRSLNSLLLNINICYAIWSIIPEKD